MTEAGVRAACARALRIAGARRSHLILWPLPVPGPEGFSTVAYAKIMAQEIYRYARRSKNKRGASRLDIISTSPKDLRVFRKTVYGYLRHLLHKLSAGPYITVDTIIETGAGIVLVKRSNPPFGWALPGGFVDYGETLEGAARREAREETGLRVKNLRQLHTYSGPRRDPRFHTITTVFVCQAAGRPKAASDAADARVFKKEEWFRLPLAFDHRKVLEDYLRQKQHKKI